jgi:hypothetical protein
MTTGATIRIVQSSAVIDTDKFSIVSLTPLVLGSHTGKPARLGHDERLETPLRESVIKEKALLRHALLFDTNH